MKVDLHSLFYNMDVRIYGIPGYGSPAEEEAELLFNGILATQESKVLVYKFRHIDRERYLYRDISYAVFVTPKMGISSFWIIFPNNCGLDSGGGYSSYRHFESLIEMLKQKLDVEVTRYDVKYDELEGFLLRKATGFFSASFIENRLAPFHLFLLPSKVLEGSEDHVKKFIERFEKKEYAQALRDLRALVQQAQENIAKIKKLDYSSISRQTVHELADFLIKENQLDGRLLPWFDAFASVANLASHRNFPTTQDMQNFNISRRVLLTFYLGAQLINELDAIVSRKIDLREVEFEIADEF